MKGYIYRAITPFLTYATSKFPIVTVTGPRQSGKSTLLKNCFKDYQYITLENADIREMALMDPRGFLKKYSNHIILDEIQRVPQLMSYLQTHVDDENQPGMYLLAGSQSFLQMQGLSQSLAGRTALLTLLPFSRKELKAANLLPDSIDSTLFQGMYPRIYNMDISPSFYYPSYIQTYVERDVRDILKVTDLNKFIRFIKLCAGRTGQILNMSALANETGITSTTAEGWLSVLEASYICYRLQPYYKNFNKRIIKAPKLYFYDTGLACNLLGITSPEQVSDFYLRGGLFENLVINQFIKNDYNSGKNPDLYYWRDSSGNEIDLINVNSTSVYAYEIKASATFHSDFFKTLDKWGHLASLSPDNLNVIYTGDDTISTSKGNLISFQNYL